MDNVLDSGIICMMDIVEVIFECYKKGTPSNMLNCLCGCSPKDIRVVMIEILNWLKLEYKRVIWIKEGRKTSLKPLMLNDSDVWCKKLREMVDKEDLFHQYFSINDNKFDFAPNITEEERMKARKKAFDYYNPQKRS